ncbi:MAG: type III secretion inner membrane ring lipoprotein SctJ [Gammaproteobacteria bacterium]|nr:type III secretion inner membrane ring lipoprotein SctJ [Gammaproteobacteria bacterium]MDE0273936.1 type III secretion inner membrane ring lipoprotein SctJ [Gammaproteobacteria bacterium]
MAIAVALLAGGCGKTVLYSELDEQQGNEMLALLLQHNIGSEKRAGKDNMVSLLVASESIPEAVGLLGRYGYPKRQFTTIADVFNADKLIATPYEDHTRYTYALSQELADTLSQLDGVMTARVHLVVPQEDDESGVSSAAVFIKHNPNYDLDEHIPQMRSIVSSAIEGLGYESVNVALFPARETGPLQRLSLGGDEPLQSVLSIKLAADSVLSFYLVLGSFLAALFLSVCANIYLYMVRRQSAPVPDEAPVTP